MTAERGSIWAFRHAEANPLMLLRRQAGGSGGDTALHHADSAGTLAIHSDEAAEIPLVVISSKQITRFSGR